ncbi:hypothetical protein S7711_09694 [Stachybotrys chartarum IBT 7711]|uniref:Uncharacterized protein n=1 Tax=Stachybotrys chartarum (strain CBS 109288 / IBT 7711) TaxID=1280523 RepID=A0A084B1Y3_STACB|nr:hypothetical protein S7711_09694 [Stachybotrys chartarum IBT 7711]KFA80412.1 hypothetical protein S40288_10303 [Stachybotrys chartarum IBT 40288]
MPTNKGRFEVLPNELILQIAGLLPITDVLSLKSATHNSMPILVWRIQPSEYLKSTGPFINVDDLMDVMAKHGAAISGSRALAYFLPGSAVNTSDWDIYVPPIPTSVIAVKNALENSGVTFESCLQRAARQLQRGSVFLTANQMVSIAHEANQLKRAWLPQEQTVVDAVRRRYPALRNIGRYARSNGSIGWIGDISPIAIDANGLVSTMPRYEEGYPATIAARVLYGSARKGGRTVPVQLVVGSVDPRKPSIAEPLYSTIFRSIFSFYASHVQCILTKHIAFHMYYTLAAQKTAYTWRVPQVLKGKAEAAIQKYKQRGFQFTTAPHGTDWNLRSAQDSYSCLIELKAGGQCYPIQSQIRNLQWQHNGGSIRLIPQTTTVEARAELLKFGIISR